MLFLVNKCSLGATDMRGGTNHDRWIINGESGFCLNPTVLKEKKNILMKEIFTVLLFGTQAVDKTNNKGRTRGSSRGNPP